MHGAFDQLDVDFRRRSELTPGPRQGVGNAGHLRGAGPLAQGGRRACWTGPFLMNKRWIPMATGLSTAFELCPRQCAPGSVISRHSWQLSRDIVDTSTSQGGRPCRKHSWSSPLWCWKTAAKARWHETTTSPGNGYSSWSAATRPRVRLHSSRAHGAPTLMPAPWAPSWKTVLFGSVKR